MPASLRILSDIMASMGGSTVWSQIDDKVRHGGKLSEALSTTKALPPMAVRTLRLGEEAGQLPTLAGRIAGVYESKLPRSPDPMMRLVRPLAILVISTIDAG